MKFECKKLREARLTSGVSIATIAAMLDCATGTVANWERGKYEPDASDLGVIAALTGKPLDYFFAVEEPCPDPR